MRLIVSVSSIDMYNNDVVLVWVREEVESVRGKGVREQAEEREEREQRAQCEFVEGDLRFINSSEKSILSTPWRPPRST